MFAIYNVKTMVKVKAKWYMEQSTNKMKSQLIKTAQKLVFFYAIGYQNEELNEVL